MQLFKRITQFGAHLAHHKKKLNPLVKRACKNPAVDVTDTAPVAIVGCACIIWPSSCALVCGFTLPSCRGFVVLSKVFVFAIIMSSVLITGVVAAVGTYPCLVLRDS